VEDLVESVTRGNVAEVKVVLASVALALAAYQLVLIAVGYGKLRPGFLASAPASAAHRASGDAIVVVMVVAAGMCLSSFEIEDATFHAIVATALLVVIALKIVVLRWWHAAGRFLPVLGVSVFVLLALTWLSSAGAYLAEG
jgi:hypothetical protein